MKLITISLVLCLQLMASCATTGWNGFQAAVSVDTTGKDLNLIDEAKVELVSRLKNLGFVKSEIKHYTGASNFEHYRHPEHNTVFYNLYLNESNRINITIRDARRTYGSSEELRKEVEGLLDLLKKKFGEDRVKFEQQSTFLS